MKFKEKVLKVVSQIPEGKFLTYKKVAILAGNKKAFRAAGQILAKNINSEIPCHRVIKSNGEIGGYFGKKELSWKKAGFLLKEGVIGILPTDTIYGICCSAFKKKSIEKLYSLKRRDKRKPAILLISSLKDLKIFGIKLSKWQKEILNKILSFRISFILPCKSEKFFYLHRGKKCLAFRIPKNKTLLKILSISGPILAPSANWEGFPPATTISEARKYFKNKVFYLNGGKISSLPSTILDLREKRVKIIRKGKDFLKINKFLQKLNIPFLIEEKRKKNERKI